MNAMCESNGFLWIPDNSSGSGGTNDSVAQVQLSPFQFVANILRPGTETEWFEPTPDPVLNRIYIAVYADSTSGQQGFRVLDTQTTAWIDNYSQIGPPQLRYIQATCLQTALPVNPFIGQSVYVTNYGAPDVPVPIPVWWDGVNWRDAQGNVRF